MFSFARKHIPASPNTTDSDTFRPLPCRPVGAYFREPSPYHDGGYVQHYRWVVQPNNTLIVLPALNDSFNRRYASQRDGCSETVIWDEICDGAIAPETIQAIKDIANDEG